MDVRIAIPTWARQIFSDLTDMDRNPRPVDASRVSSITLRLPDDAYFEYGFIDAQGEMRADPDNPERADNPWYKQVSAVRGPDYRPDRLADPPPHAVGRLDRLRPRSAALGQERRVMVYTPAGHEGAELPALIAQDGVAFLRIARLPELVEALVAAGEARPARLVFVEPLDRRAEYGFDPAYREFLTEELPGFLDERYPGTGERLLLGASLGGLVSAVAALERPDLFAAVATLSAALLGGPDDPDFYGSRHSWVVEQVRSRPRLPVRWHVATGTLEWLGPVNREFAAALRERGYQLEYAERNAGHNWTNWRDLLPGAVRTLLRPGTAPEGAGGTAGAPRPD